MNEFEQVVKFLENGKEGDYTSNEENGRTVEIANMAGGRYLFWMEDDETGLTVTAGMTDSEPAAYAFLVGRRRPGTRMCPA